MLEAATVTRCVSPLAVTMKLVAATLKRLENCSIRGDCRLVMKHLLLTTIAAALLLGCGKQEESPAPEAKSVEPVSAPVPDPSPAIEAQPVEPVVESSQPEQPPVKHEAPDIPIHKAIKEGDIQAVMQHLAAGTDVNAKDERGETALFSAIVGGTVKLPKRLSTKERMCV